MGAAKPEFSISSLKTETTLSDLIHRAGHDIGNPLTSVISLSSLIERSQKDAGYALSPEDLSRYAAGMLSDAWKVQGIVERLVLMFSDRGTNPEPIDLRSLAQEAIKKTLRKARFRNADVLFTAESEGLTGRIDPAQGEWLFAELLSNALSAEPGEDDEISVSAKLSNGTGGAEFVVENRFSHELPAELSTLFEPFVKAPQSAKGTGLGLTAALAVVERAGGALTIDSDGNRFRATVVLKF